MEAERIAKKLEFLKTDMTLLDSSIAAYIVYYKNINLRSDSSNRIADIPSLVTYKKGMEDDLLAQEWRAKELNASVELVYGFMPADYMSSERNKSLMVTLVLALFLSVLTAVFSRAVREVTNPKRA